VGGGEDGGVRGGEGAVQREDAAGTRLAGADPALSEASYREVARRITWTLLAAQSLGSAGFLAAATVNAIVGAQLSGRPSWAGLPSATYQVGAALAAFGWGRAMDRFGRRAALVLGLGAGIAGASLAVGAVAGASFAALLAGLALMGSANSALQLARFVAAEVHPPAERGRAIAHVVMGGTVGAIVGPLLSGPMGRLARGLGVDELAGPYAASAALFAMAALVIFLRLRPDPGQIGREIARGAAATAGSASPDAPRPLRLILRERATRVAMATLILAQVVMVMLMVITSLHMKDHHHPLGRIAAVLSSHVVGMYAFSVVSGRMADRWGRGPTILGGAVLLSLACLTAPLSPAAVPLGVSLFLLGLGWNLCYVGGSSLLADQLAPAERARTQGFNDFLMGAASATGSLGSGWVFAALGYGAMGVVAASAALVPFVLALRFRRLLRPAAAAH
jgi:MFS family permease